MSDLLGAVVGVASIWVGWKLAKPPKQEEPRRAMLERQPNRSVRGEWRLTHGGVSDFRQARRAYWFLNRFDHHHHRHRRL